MISINNTTFFYIGRHTKSHFGSKHVYNIVSRFHIELLFSTAELHLKSRNWLPELTEPLVSESYNTVKKQRGCRSRSRRRRFSESKLRQCHSPFPRGVRYMRLFNDALGLLTIRRGTYRLPFHKSGPSARYWSAHHTRQTSVKHW